MKIPTTSTTLLRDLAQDSQHARWSEFVARYRPMMEAYMRNRYTGTSTTDRYGKTTYRDAQGRIQGSKK